jgi:hypothetical protein
MVYIGDINAGGQAVQGQEYVVTSNKMMMDGSSPLEAFSSPQKAYILKTTIGQRIRASGLFEGFKQKARYEQKEVLDAQQRAPEYVSVVMAAQEEAQAAQREDFLS